MHEADLDKLAGMRLQLEVQVNTLESANINANTLDVMRKGANALKDIHNGLCVLLPYIYIHIYRNFSPALVFSFLGFVVLRVVGVIFFCSNINKVDDTMASINEQRDIANDISEAISNTANIGIDIDEVRRDGRVGVGACLVAYWISMACRTISRLSLGNSSRRISTSDFWAQTMYQCTPQRVRAASKCGIKRQRNTKMRNSRHCKLHLQCHDGFSCRPLALFSFITL